MSEEKEGEEKDKGFLEILQGREDGEIYERIRRERDLIWGGTQRAIDPELAFFAFEVILQLNDKEFVKEISAPLIDEAFKKFVQPELDRAARDFEAALKAKEGALKSTLRSWATTTQHHVAAVEVLELIGE